MSYSPYIPCHCVPRCLSWVILVFNVFGLLNYRVSKDVSDMHGLIMHTYNARNTDLRVDHLGLHKALCVLMGWDFTEAPDDSKAYQLLSADDAQANRDDLIIWPPTVLIHNTSSGKKKDGRFEGMGNKEMDYRLQGTSDFCIHYCPGVILTKVNGVKEKLAATVCLSCLTLFSQILNQSCGWLQSGRTDLMCYLYLVNALVPIPLTPSTLARQVASAY